MVTHPMDLSNHRQFPQEVSRRALMMISWGMISMLVNFAFIDIL
jgi:hypothetical protein